MNTLAITNPQLDERDQAILAHRIQARDKLQGPRVGDFVQMPDGTVRRFTYDWDTDIQTTCSNFGEGSHYLQPSGHVSYSGALDPAVPKDRLEEVEGPIMGNFWMFHHDYAAAHNGVYFSIPCRVFRLLPDSSETKP